MYEIEHIPIPFFCPSPLYIGPEMAFFVSYAFVSLCICLYFLLPSIKAALGFIIENEVSFIEWKGCKLPRWESLRQGMSLFRGHPSMPSYYLGPLTIAFLAWKESQSFLNNYVGSITIYKATSVSSSSLIEGCLRFSSHL